jgi:hypothetical protein
MNKEDFERIEKEELELAVQRAIARKEGSLDVENNPRIFTNLVESGAFINPREERLKIMRHRQMAHQEKK